MLPKIDTLLAVKGQSLIWKVPCQKLLCSTLWSYNISRPGASAATKLMHFNPKIETQQPQGTKRYICSQSNSYEKDFRNQNSHAK